VASVKDVSTVYALVDPLAALIRYVGQTVLPLRVRLADHLCDKTPGAKWNWIRDTLKRNLRPTIVPLARCPHEYADGLEAWFIAYGRKHWSLINVADRGTGMNDPHVRAKIADTLKRRWQDPTYVEKQRRSRTWYSDPSFLAKTATAHKQLWSDPEWRAKEMDRRTGPNRYYDWPEFRQSLILRAREQWQRPEYREKMAKLHKSAAFRKRIRERMRQVGKATCQGG